MIANARDHSLLSSYREKLLEHLFVGEVMRYVWLSRVKRLEVLKPQVDDGGYDLGTWGNGQSKDHAFKTAGVFPQVCKLHRDNRSHTP